MKKLLLLTLLSLSGLAMACPNLTGEYQCYDDENGYYSVTVSQKGSGAKTVFTVIDEIDGKSVFHADNKWRKVSQDGMKGKEKYNCKGNAVIYNANFVAPQSIKVNVTAKVELDASQDLQTTSNAQVNGQNYPAESSTCTRL